MVEPNSWMRCAQRVSELGLAGADAPSADLLVDALQILLWLCSEHAPVPHSIEIGPKKSVVFGWQQGGATVEVHAIQPGRSVWRAANGKGDVSASDQLDAEASQTLRSFIPLVREPSMSDGSSQGTHSTEERRARRPRGRPRRRRD